MLIEMTDEEKNLWEQITHYWKNDFDSIRGHTDKWEDDEIGSKQRLLMLSLIQRDAIPMHRWRWVDDADFAIGLNKSRLKIFCKNFGSASVGIFEHPHWYMMGYLPFLVGVINLPDQIVDAFREDIRRREKGYDLGMKYRKIAKSLGLPKKSAEEFFKLAVDCECDHYTCHSVRNIIFKYLK